MLTRRNLLLYLICAATLAACGQTGPLYLPNQPTPPQATRHAVPAAATIIAPAASSLPAAATATPPTPASPPPQRMLP